MSNHVETGSLIQDQNVTGLSINRKDGEEKVPNDAKPSRFLERQRNRLEHSTSVQSPSVDEVSEGASGISLSDKTKRVIYPNVPYSPYSSPRVRRKVPLKESRRVSIDKSGAFLQLNQYRLLDSIGQVWSEEKCFTVPTFRCIYTSSSGLSELLNVYMNVGIENMEIRRKIVQGSYGLVKLAYNEEDDTHYAMKILSKKKLLKKAGIFGIQNQNRKGVNPLDRIYREIAVLKKLHHPNIVKLVEVLDDPVEDNLYMVFELVKRGEVMHLPTDSPLSEAQAWEYFRDVVLGLEYLHFQRIIHRDIKPSNLLLGENGHVQIADLSVCNEFDGIDACLNNSAGTPAFTAPEAISATTHFSGKAYDVWSLGVTLFGFVYGRVPFDGGSVPAVYNSIRNEPLVLPKSPETSKDLQDLISRMLEKDPSKRITLQDIKNHKWVTKNGRYVLPTEDENCQLVEVTDEEIRDVVTSIPKLNTLILIKAMLKKHSFQNPFSLDTRLRRLYCTGRSHSAPGSCNFFNSLPSSSQNSLTPVSEASSSQHQRASKKSSSLLKLYQIFETYLNSTA